MATNHISVEALTDHIMNSDSSSCEELEDETEQLTTDDPAPVSDCTLLDSASTSSRGSASGSSVNSLLSRLHRLTSSKLSRKWVIDRKPPKGKKHSKGPNRQPSSAAADRVFLLLISIFEDQQLASLKDYLEASIMMQYKAN